MELGRCYRAHGFDIPKFFEAVLRELKNHPDLHFPAIEAFVEVNLSLLGSGGKSHGEVLKKLALLLPMFIDVSQLISVAGHKLAAGILLLSVIVRLWRKRKDIALFGRRIAGVPRSVDIEKIPSSVAVGGSNERDATRFLNALRGFKPGDTGAASINVALSKEDVAVYHGFSDRVQFPFEAVFADIPGQHQLEKYSSLLIFVGSYVSDADVRTAREARKREIFSAFVHADCDRELENDDVNTADPVAVQNYLTKRRAHYASNLRKNKAEDLAELPLFFVSARAVFALMTGAPGEGIVVLDELRLINAVRLHCIGDDAAS